MAESVFVDASSPSVYLPCPLCSPMPDTRFLPEAEMADHLTHFHGVKREGVVNTLIQEAKHEARWKAVPSSPHLANGQWPPNKHAQNGQANTQALHEKASNSHAVDAKRDSAIALVPLKGPADHAASLVSLGQRPALPAVVAPVVHADHGLRILQKRCRRFLCPGCDMRSQSFIKVKTHINEYHPDLPIKKRRPMRAEMRPVVERCDRTIEQFWSNSTASTPEYVGSDQESVLDISDMAEVEAVEPLSSEDPDVALPFSVGDLVWAKITGYPPWPSVIIEELLQSKDSGQLSWGRFWQMRRNSPLFHVMFLEERSVAWVSYVSLARFEGRDKTPSFLSKKKVAMGSAGQRTRTNLARSLDRMEELCRMGDRRDSLNFCRRLLRMTIEHRHRRRSQPKVPADWPLVTDTNAVVESSRPFN